MKRKHTGNINLVQLKALSETTRWLVSTGRGTRRDAEKTLRLYYKTSKKGATRIVDRILKRKP